jgi:hypothetical protein
MTETKKMADEMFEAAMKSAREVSRDYMVLLGQVICDLRP